MRTIDAMAALLTHLWSAGMTCQGAHSVEQRFEHRLVGGLEVVPELAVVEVGGIELPALVRLVEARLQALALLVLRDVQHEFEDRRAVLDEHLLEGVDLAVARLDLLGRRELAHLDDEHLLVVRAVEDADRAAARRGLVHAPEEIVGALLLARRAEGGDVHAERAGGVEDVADRAVLAAGVGALQHDEQRPPALRVEDVLQPVDLRRIGGCGGLGGLLVGETKLGGGVALGEAHAPAGLHDNVVGEAHPTVPSAIGPIRKGQRAFTLPAGRGGAHLPSAFTFR